MALNRTDRLYAIVEELRAAGPRGRTAARMGARFEVSVRTVKRDIAALQQSGVPIWAGGGPGGGYVLDAAVTLPPLTFTPGEATAIATALATRPGLPFGADGRSALTKVLGAMSPAGRDSASSLAARVWIRSEPGDARPPVARVLEEALRGQVVVVLDYLDATGRSTAKRPVEPMAFASDRGHWYLLAWCRRRRAGRWFRLDRIAAAWPTTEGFSVRDLTEVFGRAPDDADPVNLGLTEPAAST